MTIPNTRSLDPGTNVNFPRYFKKGVQTKLRWWYVAWFWGFMVFLHSVNLTFFVLLCLPVFLYLSLMFFFLVCYSHYFTVVLFAGVFKYRCYPALLLTSSSCAFLSLLSGHCCVEFAGCKWISLTWRIIPVSKWLVTSIYKPFRPFVRGTTLLRGLTNHGY